MELSKTFRHFSTLYLFLCLLVLIVAIETTTAQHYWEPYNTFKPGYCNICRDVPGEDPYRPTRFRQLTNGQKEFMMNGKAWTCQFLQDQVQDVNPYTSHEDEARWCGMAQQYAESNCDCAGPFIPPMNHHVKEINPACDLCKGMDLPFVPDLNSNKITDTGVAGSMNCLGLYRAMADGIMNNNLCLAVAAKAGPECCNFEKIVIGQREKQVQEQNQPQCKKATQSCEINSDCCDGLMCATKVLGRLRTCTSRRKRNQRQSIAGGAIGGAAGRSRNRGS